LRFNLNSVPGSWSGYSLQILGMLRASASLWVFRFYPCPRVLCFDPKFAKNKMTASHSEIHYSALFFAFSLAPYTKFDF
jgi:hypothetical protein